MAKIILHLVKNHLLSSIRHSLVYITYSIGERGRKFLIGSAALLATNVFINITRFIVLMLITRLYTKEEFGLWATVTSTTAILVTTDFGIGNSLRNKLSLLSCQGEGGDCEAREYYLSILCFLLFACFFVSLLLFLLSTVVPYGALFKTSDKALQQAGGKILLLLQFIVLLGIPFGIGINAFYSYQESHYYAGIIAMQSLFSSAVVIILIFLKASITSITVALFLSILIISIAGTGVFLFKHGWSPFDIKFRKILPLTIQLLPLGLRFFVVQISYAYLMNATTLVLSGTVGMAQAGEFNLVQKLFLSRYPYTKAYSILFGRDMQMLLLEMIGLGAKKHSKLLSYSQQLSSDY